MEQEDKNLQAQPSETQEKPEKQPLPKGYEAYLSLFDLVRMLAVITLAACLVYNSLAKGFWKQLYVLFGLIVGYIVSLFFGMVDFASMKETVSELGIIALPRRSRTVIPFLSTPARPPCVCCGFSWQKSGLRSLPTRSVR